MLSFLHWFLLLDISFSKYLTLYVFISALVSSSWHVFLKVSDSICCHFCPGFFFLTCLSQNIWLYMLSFLPWFLLLDMSFSKYLTLYVVISALVSSSWHVLMLSRQNKYSSPKGQGVKCKPLYQGFHAFRNVLCSVDFTVLGQTHCIKLSMCQFWCMLVAKESDLLKRT